MNARIYRHISPEPYHQSHKIHLFYLSFPFMALVYHRFALRRKIKPCHSPFSHCKRFVSVPMKTKVSQKKSQMQLTNPPGNQQILQQLQTSARVPVAPSSFSNLLISFHLPSLADIQNCAQPSAQALEPTGGAVDRPKRPLIFYYVHFSHLPFRSKVQR